MVPCLTPASALRFATSHATSSTRMSLFCTLARPSTFSRRSLTLSRGFRSSIQSLGPYKKTVAAPKDSPPRFQRPIPRFTPSISSPRKIRYRHTSKVKKPVSNIRRYSILALLLAPSITFLAVGVLYGYGFSEPTSKQGGEKTGKATRKEVGNKAGEALKDGLSDPWMTHVDGFRVHSYSQPLPWQPWQPWLVGLYIYGSLE